ncbi:hypothetical protein TNCV_499031 [Trichonephila clavipes]|nr:hypothetical protein TNCV_499031 [Trichonephila clavipes]
MVQRSREKEQEQQRLNGTEDILLKVQVFEITTRSRPASVTTALYGTPFFLEDTYEQSCGRTASAGSDVVQSGRPIFDDFFQHLWAYIGNNTANVVFQMVKRLWLIRIDQ